MNLLSPPEIMESYAVAGGKKATAPAGKLFLLGIVAGFIIGCGAAVTNTATYAIANISIVRIICGLLFPLGLGIVTLLGAELFTGNCMLPVSVLHRQASVLGLLRNWAIVYLGNMAGGLLLAAGCAFYGQLDYSSGGLGAYTIKVAAAKCSIQPGNALVLGIFCNLLVCMGVLCSLSARGTAGRILGAYIPVLFFVVAGFEHSVANMYYIPAGLFALQVPAYAGKAAALGISVEGLNWASYLLRNLLPVTVGNIIGGAGLGILMWWCHLKKATKQAVNKLG